PTATPLTGPTKFHGIKPDAHNHLAVLLNVAFCRHQCQGASHILTLIENLDPPTPSHLLAIIDLAQMQHLPLDNAAIGHTPVLHHTPIVKPLAILFATAKSQKRDGAQL